MKEYEFVFSVPCFMNYSIVAPTKAQAREILLNDGAEINGEMRECPSGELSLEAEHYHRAELVDEMEIIEYD